MEGGGQATPSRPREPPGVLPGAGRSLHSSTGRRGHTSPLSLQDTSLAGPADRSRTPAVGPLRSPCPLSSDPPVHTGTALHPRGSNSSCGARHSPPPHGLRFAVTCWSETSRTSQGPDTCWQGCRPRGAANWLTLDSQRPARVGSAGDLNHTQPATCGVHTAHQPPPPCRRGAAARELLPGVQQRGHAWTTELAVAPPGDSTGLMDRTVWPIRKSRIAAAQLAMLQHRSPARYVVSKQVRRHSDVRQSRVVQSAVGNTPGCQEPSVSDCLKGPRAYEKTAARSPRGRPNSGTTMSLPLLRAGPPGAPQGAV